MYATFNGPDGQSNSVAIDPTAPGGLQGQIANAVARLQNPHGAPQPSPLPPMPSYLPNNAYQSAPMSQSRPFVCSLRYQGRLANGQVQWMTRAINCPQGMPPGMYVHVPGNGR